MASGIHGRTLLLLNSHADVIDLLTDWFGALGATVHHARSLEMCRHPADARTLMETIHPDLVLFDLAPPYERNWRCFLHLAEIGLFGTLPFIRTTANRRALDHLVGPTGAFEIIGTPHDLWRLQDLVEWRLAARQRVRSGVRQ